TAKAAAKIWAVVNTRRRSRLSTITPAGSDNSRNGASVKKYSTPNASGSLPVRCATTHWNDTEENQNPSWQRMTTVHNDRKGGCRKARNMRNWRPQRRDD